MRRVLLILALLFGAVSCNYDSEYRGEEPAGGESDYRVVEYMPAPGQFINEGFEARTMAEAIDYAESRLARRQYVSLGGFGGYIVFRFAEPITNLGGYDFAIQGNAFTTSSEPGIVWVMCDANTNGLADDVWYELAGSETGAATTVANYSVTYFRPTADSRPVAWRDSEGAEGQIDYLPTQHKQPTYYPLWVDADSYTLSGTRLAERNYQNSTTWVAPAYEWGYADNYSAHDWLAERKTVNCFDIAMAVDANGVAVELPTIDFVKVQSAVNAKSGHLGEISTEVCDIFRYAN